MTDQTSSTHTEQYLDILETIDGLAKILLTEITLNEDVDTETTQTATQQLRTIHTEVQPLLVMFQSEGGVDAASHPQMKTRRGPGTVSHLGPDPTAFERTKNKERTDE